MDELCVLEVPDLSDQERSTLEELGGLEVPELSDQERSTLEEWGGPSCKAMGGSKRRVPGSSVLGSRRVARKPASAASVPRKAVSASIPRKAASAVPRQVASAVPRKAASAVPRKSAADLQALLWATVQGSDDATVFLELFSGVGHCASCARQAGHLAVALDILQGYDLCDEGSLQVLREWILAGRVQAVALGTPCETWTMARRGRRRVGRRGFPPPLRNASCLWGLPGLTPKEQEKVRTGNCTLQATIRIIEWCVEADTPVAVENPLRSFFWQVPELLRLVSPETAVVVLDLCRFGAQWQKPTKLMLWKCGAAAARLRLRCCRTRLNGRVVCSVTGAPHFQLTGLGGRACGFRTKAAAEYPLEMARLLGEVLCGAKKKQQGSAAWSVCACV